MDALFFLIGSFAGVFIFGEIAPFIDVFFSGTASGFMGTITVYQFLGVSAGVIAFFVVLIALGGFWGSEWVEKRFGKVIDS